MSNISIIIGLILTLLAPVIGGFIYGFERIVKARMQNRTGPCLLQPFYDFFKLLGKRKMIIHSSHAFFGIMHFITMWVAVGLFFLGGDILMVIFFHLLSTVMIIMGGFSVKSVFSHMGSNRQAISTLAYEPVLVVIAMSFYLATGSFSINEILTTTSTIPIIVKLPLSFIALLIILPIKLKKSPFDVADAHQEIIGGAEIEYSGIYYEFLYTAKWLEYVFAYAWVFLFFGASTPLSIGLGILAIIIVFLIINALDNSSARLGYKNMLSIALGAGGVIAVANLVYLTMTNS